MNMIKYAINGKKLNKNILKNKETIFINNK